MPYVDDISLDLIQASVTSPRGNAMVSFEKQVPQVHPIPHPKGNILYVQKLGSLYLSQGCCTRDLQRGSERNLWKVLQSESTYNQEMTWEDQLVAVAVTHNPAICRNKELEARTG